MIYDLTSVSSLKYSNLGYPADPVSQIGGDTDGTYLFSFNAGDNVVWRTHIAAPYAFDQLTTGGPYCKGLASPVGSVVYILEWFFGPILRVARFNKSTFVREAFGTEYAFSPSNQWSAMKYYGGKLYAAFPDSLVVGGHFQRYDATTLNQELSISVTGNTAGGTDISQALPVDIAIDANYVYYSAYDFSLSHFFLARRNRADLSFDTGVLLGTTQDTMLGSGFISGSDLYFSSRYEGITLPWVKRYNTSLALQSTSVGISGTGVPNYLNALGEDATGLVLLGSDLPGSFAELYHLPGTSNNSLLAGSSSFSSSSDHSRRGTFVQSVIY